MWTVANNPVKGNNSLFDYNFLSCYGDEVDEAGANSKALKMRKISIKKGSSYFHIGFYIWNCTVLYFLDV